MHYNMDDDLDDEHDHDDNDDEDEDDRCDVHDADIYGDVCDGDDDDDDDDEEEDDRCDVHDADNNGDDDDDDDGDDDNYERKMMKWMLTRRKMMMEGEDVEEENSFQVQEAHFVRANAHGHLRRGILCGNLQEKFRPGDHLD